MLIVWKNQEQFNRKIVASAPVGICILRTSSGTNILSNELAHNYLTLLTQEDRLRLTEMICGQQVNFVDVLTGSNTNLQISFVHSRYRNENVAICVLVDVSARVKMEQSLHEIAQEAEQASQSKSMFLATVSHELRTPLYGIIGNLDLLKTKALPAGADSLVTAMNNSSSLLLKIISDILDFSKIESEQLKIEPREFSPREVIAHITANYLAMAVKNALRCGALLTAMCRCFWKVTRCVCSRSSLTCLITRLNSPILAVLSSRLMSKATIWLFACATAGLGYRRRKLRACLILFPGR